MPMRFDDDPRIVIYTVHHVDLKAIRAALLGGGYLIGQVQQTQQPESMGQFLLSCYHHRESAGSSIKEVMVVR